MTVFLIFAGLMTALILAAYWDELRDARALTREYEKLKITAVTGADDFERWVLAETDLDYGAWLIEDQQRHEAEAANRAYKEEVRRRNDRINEQRRAYREAMGRTDYAECVPAMNMAAMQQAAMHHRYQEMLRNTQPLPGDYRKPVSRSFIDQMGLL